MEAIRASGRMTASVLKTLEASIRVGMTTKDVADMAAKALKKLGAKPAFLGYQGFPDIICISVNDEVVHGIPLHRKLEEDDIVGIDFGVNYRGMITDAARSVIVGTAATQSQRLVKATKEALDTGIDQVKAGAKIGDISNAIEARLAADNLGIVEDLVGHGVGYELHEPPEIPNFGPAGQGKVLHLNEAIAIEPMATLGGKEVYIERDGWTVRTKDGSLSAHFEDTVLVTETGAEILTRI